MFPVEIWEEILKHGEAKDLVRFKRVSITWDAIITQILERSDVWYRQCINDIPDKFWTSLLEHQVNQNIEQPEPHKTKNNSQVWLQMYKSWKGWHRIFEKNPHIQTFEPLPQHRITERITCVATQDSLDSLNSTRDYVVLPKDSFKDPIIAGNIIAIGSSEGYIAFYDATKTKIFYRADHAEFLENVQLFRSGTVLLACSSSLHHRVKFWNLQTKNEEKNLQCRASFITASHAGCHMVRNDLLTAYFLSRLDRKSEQSLLVDEIYLRKVLVKISLPGNEIVAAGADDNMLTIYTTKNRRMHAIWKKEAICLKGPQIDEPEIRVRYYRIFKAHVAACVGVYGEVGFSIDGNCWKIYNLFKKFGAPVTTVLFHVGLLALGLQSGEVYLFSVKDTKTLENFDFETTESRKLMLDTEAIISLNVTEYDSAQYIVAASNRHVHLVKFN